MSHQSRVMALRNISDQCLLPWWGQHAIAIGREGDVEELMWYRKKGERLCDIERKEREEERRERGEGERKRETEGRREKRMRFCYLKKANILNLNNMCNIVVFDMLHCLVDAHFSSLPVSIIHCTQSFCCYNLISSPHPIISNRTISPSA